jgi:predicted PurR-regulated permease PerM
MYTGFKFIGVLGLFVGPILLIIFKNVFKDVIDNGFIKVLVGEE